MDEAIDIRRLQPKRWWFWTLLALLAVALLPLSVPAGLLFWLFTTPAGHGLLRRFWPIARAPFFAVVVTRYDDAHEVLTRDDVFEVYGSRVAKLNAPESFLLGLQAGADFDDYQRLVMQVFRREDIAERVAQACARQARAIVAANPRQLDAAGKLVTATTIEVCREYYGVPIPQHEETKLAHAMFLLSRWMFDPGLGCNRLEKPAEAAIAYLRGLVDGAIATERAKPPSGDTIAGRLLLEQQRRQRAQEPSLSDERIRAVLLSMMTGFVPTSTMAGGHILDVLLTHDHMLRAARAAALADDDERLKRCLFEAMRFQPLKREPLRRAAQDYVLAEGTPRATRITKGERVLVLSRSAMMDEQRVEAPQKFDPDRPAHHSMLFGVGMHRCIGAAIAEAHATQTLKPLLEQPHLRRAPGAAGKLQRLGSFPSRLRVEHGEHAP